MQTTSLYTYVRAHKCTGMVRAHKCTGMVRAHKCTGMMRAHKCTGMPRVTVVEHIFTNKTHIHTHMQ